ncbi:MAG: hypothetical protein H0Z34_04820 [Brevibacillus sp.]|nr:hypothetical protein [Brevibacillus sp.]
MKHDYDQRFCHLSTRVEKLLLSLIAVVTLLLAAGQAACVLDPLRHLLIETERWEGRSSPP